MLKSDPCTVGPKEIGHLVFAKNSISLQPDGANLCYFKLRLFN